MRKGLHEVLPGSSFSGLSAEDFRLLLCGCPHIDIDVIKGITSFHDESRELSEHVYLYCTCTCMHMYMYLFAIMREIYVHTCTCI